jgi:hypothetical protein
MPGRAQHYQRRDSRTEGEGGEHRNTVAPFDHQRSKCAAASAAVAR